MHKSIAGRKTVPVQFFIIMAIGFLLNACAVNPVSHRMELMLVSEQGEFEIGESVDKQVREEMGIYLEKPELTSLLKETVKKIGKKSHRPDIEYRAEIVDTPDFNAFAVPGGFVYVHRGLLERINSVDELASVMGHEIAHVSARHSASQITKQQILNIGVVGASLVTGGEIQKFGDLVNMGSVLAFSKFSRDDEREADYLGMRYMVDAGFNPEGAIDAMKTIQRINDKEPDSLETWFMTHPPTSERLATLTQELKVLSSEDPEILKRHMKRNELISLLDGVVVGEYNGKEFVKGDRYYNKEFPLSISIPSGWEAHVSSKDYTAIFADAKNGSYTIFNIEPLKTKMSTSEYFNKLADTLANKGLKRVFSSGNSQKIKHGALITGFTGSSGNDPVYVNLAAFVKGENGYAFLEVRAQSSPDSNELTLRNMINGMVFLPREDALKIEPARMRIHSIKKGETWNSIMLMYYGRSDDKSKLAEYNGFTVNEMPLPGVLLKIPPALGF
jgi:predicted Zn-dependent protease